MLSDASDYSIYRRAVSQLMLGEEQLPSLPTITLDIRRALSNPKLTINQLAALIGRDPALSALLMKHASSALFRQAIAPKNLRDVITLLGLA
ncbi:hydrolase, partial [Pseudomonas sp. HMWF010]